MALDLSQISFKVNTDELKAAINTMNQVKNAVSSLEQAQAKAATQSSKASKAASDAAKAEAQAALAAIKLEKEKQKAIQESSETVEAASKRTISILEREESRYEFMIQGYSRGQAGTLAMAKAAGVAADELARIGTVLKDQRQLMAQPFDQSTSGLTKYAKALAIAKDRIGEYNSSLGLAAKYAEDFYKDKLRLTVQFEKEGRSAQQLDIAIAGLADEYRNVSSAIAQAEGKYKSQQQTIRDTAKANAYLETELQKVRFAVDEQNAALNRGSANALVRFENALKKSGKTAAEQKVLLDEYRQSVEKLQAAGAGRATDYISRAVGPQLTDIIVGLSTGQSLMTVMLQQGGQLRDQFAMMGVAGAEMGQVMRTALSSMTTSIKDTALAFGQLFVGGVMDAGKGVVNFASELLRLDKVLDWNKRRLAALGEEGFTAIGNLGRIATLVNAAVGVALGATVAAIGMLAVEFVRSTKAQDDFVRANASLGGQLGMTTEQALAFAESFNKVETNGRKALDALTLFTKAGVAGSDNLRQYIASTIELNKYVGESIEDVAKKYAELEDAPLKSLIEIAKKTGFVSIAVLENIAALEREGETAKAAAMAKDAYMEANIQKTEAAKESLSGMSLLWIDIKSGIDKAWAAMHGMLSDTTLVNVFRTAWETVAVVVSDVWYVLKQTGKEIGGIGAQIAAVMSGDFAAAKSIGEMMKADAAAARAEQDKYTASILNRNKETEKSIGLSAEERKAQAQAASSFDKMNKLMTETNQIIEKSVAKTLSLSEFTKKYTEEKSKGLNLDKQQLALIEKAAAIEWQSMQKKGGSSTKEENYYQSLLRSVTNEAIGAEAAQDKLTKAYTKMLEIAADPRFLKLNEDQKARVMNLLNEAHNTELTTQRTKDLAEAEELRGRILGTVDGLGKDYYKTIDKLNALVKAGAMGQDEATELAKALGQSTPYAKAMSEWFAKGREAITKYTAEFKKTSDEIALQNKELDYQYSLFGLSEDQQKKVTIEYQKQVKLQKALNEYEANRIKILNDASLNTDQLKNEARLQNEQEYAEKVRLINRETAYQYAAEQQKAFNEIRDGISGSIVEALFNGGKSGTQKLRNFLVEQLKKPVTLVVNAVVNTLLGSVIGSLVGGSSGSGGSGVLGSIGSSVVGQTLTSTGTSLFGGLGSGFLSGMSETMLGSSFVGPSATAAGGLTGLGATIGTYAPWIAAAAAIFSIISSLDDSGTYHTGGAAQYSAANGLTSGASGTAYDFGFGEVVAGESTITAMETLSKSLVEIFDGIAKTFGKTAGYEVATAFADDTSEDGAWGAFKISLQGVEILNWDDFRQSKWAPKEFGDGEEGYKQYLAAVASDTRQVLLDMDLPSWADQILTDLGDSASMESLTTAVQQIGVIKSAYDTLVKQVINFATITDDSFGALMEEFGGIENLASQVSSYYDQYYSETEKYQKLQAEVAQGFSDMGVTMPKSREEFRKLAEAQDLNTEAGRKAYAQIMSLATSFDTLADKAEETAAQIASSRQDLTDRILEQEAALLEAQGRSEEAAKKRRELLDAQRARENAALMALDPELAKLAYQLWLLEDATTAVTDKISAANDAYSDLQTVISNQKTVLESQKTTLNTTITSLQQIFDLLKQNTRELYLQVDSTSSMLASQGRSVIASALAGGTVEYSTLSDAISAVRNDIDTTQYATQFEQDKARLQLAADLALLQETTDDSLTLARKQLDALEQEIEQLDEVLKLAKQQLDTALGVKTAVMTVTEAVNNLNTAITELLKPTTTGTGTTPSGSSGTSTGGAAFGGSAVNGGGSGSTAVTSPYSQVTSLGSAGVAYIPITDQSYISHLDSLSSIYQSYSGTVNLAGLLADIQAAGGSLNDLSALSGFYASDWRAAAEAIGVQPFANGGVFTNSVVSSPTTFGMGLMGEAGPEAIMPLANVGGSLGVRVAKGSSDDALEKRVENLSIELQAIAVNTSKVARILERVTRDGESLLTTPAP